MKRILFVLALVFSLSTFAGSNIPTSIKLEKDNFFAITSQFDGTLLDNFTEKVLAYDKKEMYIYFDTPGGSVIALSRMARIMKGSDIKFTCIASFAASAGFMLFQHCQNRLLLSDGVLMSHNWAGGFRDEAPRILTMFNTIQSIVDVLEAVAIKKMTVDAKEYARLINSNLWMTSTLATKYKAIDGVINNVSCSSDIIKQRVRTTYRSFFGRSGVIYKSGCPLIQKVYKKSNSRNDTYVEASKTLFELSQENYKLENANWIYTGSKNLN